MSPPAQPPESPGSPASPASSAKRAVRDRVLASRRRRTPDESLRAAEAIAEHLLAWDVVRRSATVAAYVSVGREPGTRRLIEALRASGTRVLLPVLRADDDLDWTHFDGSLAPAARGLLEPTGPRVGVDAITVAGVVLVPGLAASPDGDRLGRGGGSYDRALARVTDGVPVAVLLHEDEVDVDIPTEAHDRPVTHVVTPDGVRAISRRPG